MNNFASMAKQLISNGTQPNTGMYFVGLISHVSFWRHGILGGNL